MRLPTFSFSFLTANPVFTHPYCATLISKSPFYFRGIREKRSQNGQGETRCVNNLAGDINYCSLFEQLALEVGSCLYSMWWPCYGDRFICMSLSSVTCIAHTYNSVTDSLSSSLNVICWCSDIPVSPHGLCEQNWKGIKRGRQENETAELRSNEQRCPKTQSRR